MGAMRSLFRVESRELKVLADDFCLLDREDVQEVIMSCRSYREGQQAIMKIYDKVYMD